MTPRHVGLHDLLGRLVRDENGQPVGRIFELRAERNNGDVEIVEYHLGGTAALERLGVLLSVIGIMRKEPRRVAWNRLDLSDVERPVLRS